MNEFKPRVSGRSGRLHALHFSPCYQHQVDLPSIVSIGASECSRFRPSEYAQLFGAFLQPIAKKATEPGLCDHKAQRAPAKSLRYDLWFPGPRVLLGEAP